MANDLSSTFFTGCFVGKTETDLQPNTTKNIDSNAKEKQQFLTQMANAYDATRKGEQEMEQNAKQISLNNLRTAILEGKNIEYETTGARFDTLKSILQMIVETTFNCKNKYKSI